MILQKIYRDLDLTEAVRRLREQASLSGYKVAWFYAAVQPTLFDGKEDAYVEMEVERAKH
jgi:hypothetical protein